MEPRGAWGGRVRWGRARLYVGREGEVGCMETEGYSNGLAGGAQWRV